MSLLQRTDVYQKADHRHPAFRPSGVMNSDVSEMTEIDEDVHIQNGPDDVTSSGTLNVLKRWDCCGRAGHHGICGLRKVER